MLETLILLGEALSTLLVLYGAVLVIAQIPALRLRTSEVQDPFLLPGQLHLDA